MAGLLSILFGWLPFIGDYFKPREDEIVPPKDFPSARVAIIGGGIGGCTASYYIRELCGGQVDIHVFNDNPVVGGRCAVIEFEGNTYEEGGSVIHTSNKHMSDLRKKFGLQMFDSSKVPDVPTAIFNGQKFVLHLGFSSILNKLKVLWNYGMSLFSMSRAVKAKLKSFSNIYKLQAQGEAFKTVPDLLKAMGGDSFANTTQVSAEHYFKVGLGWNTKLVDDLVCCAMKMNYGQNNEIDAFTAFVSLAGAEDGSLWSVIGGNYQIPKRALEASIATLHVGKVTKVTKGQDSKYTVEYQPLPEGASSPLKEPTTTGSSSEFDVVIIAHPLNLSSVEFINFSQPIYTDATKTPYHRTVATFVKGYPNAQLFGYPNSTKYPRDYPLTVLTNEMKNSPVSFNSLSQDIPTTVSEEEAKDYCKPLSELPAQVYKVFSNVPLTESDLSKLFASVESVSVKDWMAYPQYDPPETFPPFVLDDEGLFYINCIEKAASAMEMSCIGAKNVSLLTKDYILKTKKTV